MSLDPTQLDAVRTFLRTNMQFFTGVPVLRSQPFEFPDAPEQRGSLQDAAATKPRTGLVRGLVAFGLLLTVAGSLFQYALEADDAGIKTPFNSSRRCIGNG